jgi:hypothetical protein
VAGGVLPPRDEELARTGRWLTGILTDVEPAGRRLVQAYATWHVMRRLRASASKGGRPRTYTAHARNNIRAAADFTAWLARRGRSLRQCRQADVDDWLLTCPGACQVRDFLTWAAARQHCAALHVPGPARRSGTTISQDKRWELAARLLHDHTLDLTDRAAGCLLLLYGQQLSRIAAAVIRAPRWNGLGGLPSVPTAWPLWARDSRASRSSSRPRAVSARRAAASCRARSASARSRSASRSASARACAVSARACAVSARWPACCASSARCAASGLRLLPRGLGLVDEGLRAGPGVLDRLVRLGADALPLGGVRLGRRGQPFVGLAGLGLLGGQVLAHLLGGLVGRGAHLVGGRSAALGSALGSGARWCHHRPGRSRCYAWRCRKPGCPSYAGAVPDAEGPRLRRAGSEAVWAPARTSGHHRSRIRPPTPRVAIRLTNPPDSARARICLAVRE